MNAFTRYKLERFEQRYQEIITGLPAFKEKRLEMFKKDLESAFNINNRIDALDPEVTALYEKVKEASENVRT